MAAGSSYTLIGQLQDEETVLRIAKCMPLAVSRVFVSPFALCPLCGNRIVEPFLLMSKDVHGQSYICQ